MPTFNLYAFVNKFETLEHDHIAPQKLLRIFLVHAMFWLHLQQNGNYIHDEELYDKFLTHNLLNLYAHCYLIFPLTNQIN